jgi:primosomal protein N''
MSNMKIVALIEERAKVERAALAQAIYLSVKPLLARIEALEREIERQRLSIAGVKPAHRAREDTPQGDAERERQVDPEEGEGSA